MGLVVLYAEVTLSDFNHYNSSILPQLYIINQANVMQFCNQVMP